jgi:hypothetical protein
VEGMKREKQERVEKYTISREWRGMKREQQERVERIRSEMTTSVVLMPFKLGD